MMIMELNKKCLTRYKTIKTLKTIPKAMGTNNKTKETRARINKAWTKTKKTMNNNCKVYIQHNNKMVMK